MKTLFWVGTSRKDLAALPSDVRDVFGYALYKAEIGSEHSHVNYKVAKAHSQDTSK